MDSGKEEKGGEGKRNEEGEEKEGRNEEDGRKEEREGGEYVHIFSTESMSR